MRSLFIVIIMCTIVSTVHAETLLMSHDMYIERCLSTFGDDPLTKRVCEKQYQDIEKKELQIMAQTDTTQTESSLEDGSSTRLIDNVE